MDVRSLFDERVARVWDEFVATYALSITQQDQFAAYLALLIEWSQKINLTTIVAPSSVIKYHFQDSLQLGSAIDMATIAMSCDVGSGGGFPGIPLKIKYPHLRMGLIEVNNKKAAFLQAVVHALTLEDVAIFTDDWRTFLRHTNEPIDLFCARASLQPEELLRMYKPSSPYKQAQLVYWASQTWVPEKRQACYLDKMVDYGVGNKKHRLVFFKNGAQESK